MLQKLRIHMPLPLNLIFRSDKSHQLAVVAARRGISTKNPRCVQVEKDDAEGRGTFHILGNSPISEALELTCRLTDEDASQCEGEPVGEVLREAAQVVVCAFDVVRNL